jgi:hypothetical protein
VIGEEMDIGVGNAAGPLTERRSWVTLPLLLSVRTATKFSVHERTSGHSQV